ncbi:MAG: hypothetical protein ACXWC0_08670, partial [Burkholderiales bacterium]
GSAYLQHLGRAQKRARSAYKEHSEPQALTFLYWYAPLGVFCFFRNSVYSAYEGWCEPHQQTETVTAWI